MLIACTFSIAYFDVMFSTKRECCDGCMDQPFVSNECVTDSRARGTKWLCFVSRGKFGLELVH